MSERSRELAAVIAGVSRLAYDEVSRQLATTAPGG
jgi:hypothetical protein